MNLAGVDLNLILTERHWSWSLVGASYLATSLLIRWLAFRGILRETKHIDRAVYSEAKRLYLKNSIAGWVLFILSFILLMVFWIFSKPLLSLNGLTTLAFLAVPFLFLLSLILHFSAYTRAVLAIIRQKMGAEREY